MAWKGNISDGGILVQSPDGGLPGSAATIVSAGDLPPGPARSSWGWAIAYMHWTKKTATSLTIKDTAGNIVLKDIRDNFVLEEPRVGTTIKGGGLIAEAVGSGSELTIRVVPMSIGLINRVVTPGSP